MNLKYRNKLFRSLRNEEVIEEKRRELWKKIRAKTSYKFSRRSLSIEEIPSCRLSTRRIKPRLFLKGRKNKVIPAEEGSPLLNSKTPAFRNKREEYMKMPLSKRHSSTLNFNNIEGFLSQRVNKNFREEFTKINPIFEIDSVIQN
mmetsp:Transcript_3738/g.3139  ORF Transcript_3738/g.3139 Transcript_3738/m.3139 type:complete len:145 (+) Transcript_3738:231-665(+)